MKILVVSDSHFHNTILNNIFLVHPEIDTCIHCGDLQDDVSHLNIKNLYIVSGNNDFNLYAKELDLTIDSYHIWITHGHDYEIESGKDELEKAAHEKKANLVLFGHTHHPEIYRKDGITYLNPGSVSFPRGGKIFIPTYAILNLEKNLSYQFYHAKTHEPVAIALEENKKTSQPSASSKQPKESKPKKSFFARFKR